MGSIFYGSKVRGKIAAIFSFEHGLFNGMDVTVQFYPERGRKSHKMVLWSIKDFYTTICLSISPTAS